MSSINTNLISMNAQRNQSMSQSSLSTSMQRLSSGLRVNSAKDDAAGLAIAERMSTQVRGMNVAVRNANDAISMSQTAEGALSTISDNLQRMRELAVQSRNATNSSGDRDNLQREFKALQDEISRTVSGSKFNGQELFTSSTAQVYQVGAGTSSNDQISVDAVNLTGTSDTAANLQTALDDAATAGTDALTVLGNIMTAATKQYDGTDGVTIGSMDSAGTATTLTDVDDAIKVLDMALDGVNNARAAYGATQNRFDAVIKNLQVNVENQSAARGRIMDADFASETANLSRAQVLQQAGTAMIAQANQLPQQVLTLLR
jgi:flagellin